MTDNDGVKVVGYVGYNKTRSKQRCFHWMPPKFTHKEQTFHTPLISALDEADRVDGLCEHTQRRERVVGEQGGCNMEHPGNCNWPGHAHADKLRSLHND